MPEAADHHAQDTFTSDLEVCFEILLYLSIRLEKLKPGDTLAFTTRDPGAMDKIPDWCDARNYELLDTQALPDNQWRFLIRRPTN